MKYNMSIIVVQLGLILLPPIAVMVAFWSQNLALVLGPAVGGILVWLLEHTLRDMERVQREFASRERNSGKQPPSAG